MSAEADICATFVTYNQLLLPVTYWPTFQGRYITGHNTYELGWVFVNEILLLNETAAV